MIQDCFSSVMVNRWANLALWHDYRRGHLNDLGPNGLNGAAVQPLVWQTFQSGRHVAPATLPFGSVNGSVSVTDNAILRLTTTGTLIVFGKFSGSSSTYPTNNRAAMSKYSVPAAVWNYWFGMTAGVLGFVDSGGVVKSLGYTVPGSKTVMLACSFQHGSPAIGYANGNRVGVTATNTVIAANPGGLLYIGNIYNGLGPFDPICTALIFNTQITDAEMSQLYEDHLRSEGPLR